jgi:hypothetical protein
MQNGSFLVDGGTRRSSVEVGKVQCRQVSGGISEDLHSANIAPRSIMIIKGDANIRVQADVEISERYVCICRPVLGADLDLQTEVVDEFAAEFIDKAVSDGLVVLE